MARIIQRGGNIYEARPCHRPRKDLVKHVLTIRFYNNMAHYHRKGVGRSKGRHAPPENTMPLGLKGSSAMLVLQGSISA